ncbi:MAG: helix-turn-helix domain-containing protein [Bacteroidales bacterium]|nr:helix-turn-helix domain-containing protein [Bacteroidales bacterium]
MVPSRSTFLVAFFNESFGCCRFVYNLALAERIEACQNAKPA